MNFSKYSYLTPIEARQRVVDDNWKRIEDMERLARFQVYEELPKHPPLFQPYVKPTDTRTPEEIAYSEKVNKYWDRNRYGNK